MVWRTEIAFRYALIGASTYLRPALNGTTLGFCPLQGGNFESEWFLSLNPSCANLPCVHLNQGCSAGFPLWLGFCLWLFAYRSWLFILKSGELCFRTDTCLEVLLICFLFFPLWVRLILSVKMKEAVTP